MINNRRPTAWQRLGFCLLLFSILNLACGVVFNTSTNEEAPPKAVEPTITQTQTVLKPTNTATVEALPAAETPTELPVNAGAATVIAEKVIYHGALGDQWQNWSWDATIELAAPGAPTGSAGAIAVTYQAAWAALYLHIDEQIATREFDLLRFRLHGGKTGGQRLRVVLADSAGSFQTQGVEATATADTWTTVEVKVPNLGNMAQVSGIAWQDAQGSAQPTFYIDDIRLVDLNLAPTPTPIPVVGPALVVDVMAGHRPIDPNIYGVNFASEALATVLKLPVRRWGGNGTTRYNWQLDIASHTKDWFFENIPNENPEPHLLPVGSDTDRFVEQDRRTGTKTVLTMPLIGWTPKSREISCGFSVAKYGPQQEVDPWRPDCGNGIDLNGSMITGNDPADTSLPIDPSFVEAWLQHLVGRFGRAAEGGVAFYNLDNEPMLWNETHRDVHPEPVSYEELRERTYLYAAAIKRMDPTAQTLGPALWGWTAYFYSALDRASGDSWWNSAVDRNAHGGMPLVAWYLEQMQVYETTHGVRLVDYLDLHYYPQANGVALSPAGNAEIQELRLRSTRSLWDPTYIDESWIGEAVGLIPRMRAWVDQHYPGTKLAITEYNWGALDHINGALAQADVLGIFGREGLDMAMLWDPLDVDAPFAYAFRMYRNYDGNGAQFGDVSIEANSSDAAQLAIYGAQRSADNALTLLVINKSQTPLISNVSLLNSSAAGAAEVYQYSVDNLSAIVRLPDQTISAGGFQATFPGASLTLFIIK